MIFALFIRLFLPLFILFNCSSNTGQIVHVSDGDTFHMVTPANDKIKIRLEGVDAPEALQEFGLEAKAFAIGEVLNQKVRIEVIDTDRYGRKVARIYYGNGKDLSKEMIKKGFAWHYKAYNKETELADLENEARKKKVGLWAKKDPIPPWEYRKFGNRSPSMDLKPSNASKKSQPDLVLVCNSSGSYAYHKQQCRGLRQCSSGVTEVTIATARKAGKKPCGYCWK